MEVGSVENTGVSSKSQPSGVNQEDLFKIMLAQLKYQDPLEPMDNKEFISQLAQFTSLEQSRSINKKMESIITTSSITQSLTMLGKDVQFITDSGASIGKVTAVTFDNGVPKLTIKTDNNKVVTSVELTKIQIIR